METLFLFIIGAIIGSFLNVAGLRFNSGLTLFGRSSCYHCGKKLSPTELVPILGFLFLKGRCAGCKAKISWQYPLIEIWTGLIFATTYNLPFTIAHKVILLAVFSIYTVILIYDFRHKIIPDSLVYASTLLSLAIPLFIYEYLLIDWLSGPTLFSFFALIWLLSRGRAMGFGDAKLALSVGILLGASAGFSAIILAFWIGAVFGIILLLKKPKDTTIKSGFQISLKSEIPFAPFIVLGAWLALIFNVDLLHVSLL